MELVESVAQRSLVHGLDELAMDALQQRIGYRFTNSTLLEQALTHRSLAREHPHNQRLEFLGDAVLGLMVAELLYSLYPDADEGDLSKRLVALVNGEQLASIAREWQLGELLFLSPSEEEQRGRSNSSNLEDACEALLGAIYLDGGLDAVRPLIAQYWRPLAETLKSAPKDAKTALQEWAQGRALPLPEYKVLSAQGPAHAPDFIVEVTVNGKTAQGHGTTKRTAERLAAEALLKQLG